MVSQGLNSKKMKSLLLVPINRVLPVVLILFQLIIDKNPVSGQSLSIKFETIGPYDYNDGKAFLEGNQVHFLCAVSGRIGAGRTVVFKKDGEKLSSNGNITVPNSPIHYSVVHTVDSTDPFREKFKLSIKGVSKEDQGFYTCDVEDTGGNVVIRGEYSNSAQDKPEIVVLYLPEKSRYPDCMVEEGTIDVKVGDQINLRCTSELGNPQVALTWKRSTATGSNDDIVGSVSTSEDIMTNSVSSISITQENDGDIYTCFMKPSTMFFPNDLRTCDIGPLNIISDVPLPIINPQTQNADPGNTVNFECQLPGQPDAEFDWYWDPNWVLYKSPVSPSDTTFFSLRNVRSYHHLTKVYCKTISEGVEVSVYGLIRVSGPYEAPPNTPAPPVTKTPTKPGGDGDSDTGGGDGMGGGVGSTSANGINGPESTTPSKGKSVLIQAANINTVITCLSFLYLQAVIEFIFKILSIRRYKTLQDL